MEHPPKTPTPLSPGVQALIDKAQADDRREREERERLRIRKIERDEKAKLERAQIRARLRVEMGLDRPKPPAAPIITPPRLGRPPLTVDQRRVQTVAGIPLATYNVLRDEADRRRISVSRLVSDIVCRHLAEHLTAPKPAQPEQPTEQNPNADT